MNGKEHGIEKCYYGSGALEWEIPYSDGKRHGIEKWYFETGSLQYETPYVNGKEHGIEKGYNKDRAGMDYVVLYKKGQRVKSIKI